MSPWILAAWLAWAPAAHAADGSEALVAQAENALWDDHVDVRDVCFVLARAGIPAEELVAALKDAASSPAESAELRARARRLLARLAPQGREKCRSSEGRPAPPPSWRRAR